MNLGVAELASVVLGLVLCWGLPVAALGALAAYGLAGRLSRNAGR